MTDDQLRRAIDEAARRAAHEAVHEVLTALGMDARHPQRMQADLVYLRRQRLLSERIGIGLRLALISAAVSGVLAMLWLGVQAALKGHV